MLKPYLKKIYEVASRGDAREESYYTVLEDLLKVDGKTLKEKNPKWLQDDYVKFIRFAQWKINQLGEGVLGFITNHSYLDNPTFKREIDSIYPETEREIVEFEKRRLQ